MKLILIAAVLFSGYRAGAQNVGIGTSTPESRLSVGSNSEFRVDSSGNITRINDVPYNFPATQGTAGQALVNNGSGGLNWSSPGRVPYRGIIMCSAADTAALAAKGYIIEGISESVTRSFSPAPGTWIPFAGTTATVAGTNMQNNPAVFTGSRVLVYAAGYVYSINPTGDFWSTSSLNSVAGFGTPTAGTAVWTGTDMIIYGGTVAGNPTNKGVKFNPSTNTWTAIANGPVKSGHSAVWTGSEMIVFGGDSCACVSPKTRSVWRYNPVSNTWASATPATGGPSARSGHAAVWTGNQMVVFGGTFNGSTASGGCSGYNPATGAWTILSVAAAPDQAIYPKAVWTGTEILSWGNVDISEPFALTTRVGTVYTPATNSWSRFATEGSAPAIDGNANAVWIGTQLMLIRGTAYQKFSYTGTGKFVNVPAIVAYYLMRNNVPD
ncbi:MAG: hypothetical protein EOO06_13180 [Chitinophagaceae bacterium]|nr:MAG: hypothetical protein EOO06_13180 [Chitinophagaceae bacterium]